VKPPDVLTDPETEFDHVAALAARLLNVPLVIVSLTQDEPAAKACFAFHTSESLFAADGRPIGALHVFYDEPRVLMTRDRDCLRDLAAIVREQVEFRRRSRRLIRTGAVLQEMSQEIAGSTGDAFFRSLVCQLTRALGVAYALVAEVAAPGRARVVALCADGHLVENVEYPLHGSPCQEVLAGELCAYPRDVTALFPEDRMLAELEVDSYMGTLLCCLEGDRLGWLAVMDRQPLEDLALTESVLRLFALRAAAELDRRRYEASERVFDATVR
jgi:hypothetical protein